MSEAQTENTTFLMSEAKEGTPQSLPVEQTLVGTPAALSAEGQERDERRYALAEKLARFADNRKGVEGRKERLKGPYGDAAPLTFGDILDAAEMLALPSVVGKEQGAGLKEALELVERVAMALHDEWNGVGLWASKNTNAKDRWRFMARAAIEAMPGNDLSRGSEADGGHPNPHSPQESGDREIERLRIALEQSEQRFATLKVAYDRERRRSIQILGSAPTPSSIREGSQ